MLGSIVNASLATVPLTQMTKKTEPEDEGRDKQIREAYKSDRKQRAPHLIEVEEQRQIEKMRREVVLAVQAGDPQVALDRLKELGYGPDSREYKTVISLLHPPGKKR